MTFAQARRLTELTFIKPAAPANKGFDSGVYPGGWDIPERRGFPDSTSVLVLSGLQLACVRNQSLTDDGLPGDDNWALAEEDAGIHNLKSDFEKFLSQ